jgi:hypothetical protein
VGFRRSIANVWPDRFTADDQPSSPELRLWEASNLRLLELARRFQCYWVCFDDEIETIKTRLNYIMAQLGGRLDSAAFDAAFIPAERRFSSNSDIRASMFGLPESLTRLYHGLKDYAC